MGAHWETGAAGAVAQLAGGQAVLVGSKGGAAMLVGRAVVVMGEGLLLAAVYIDSGPTG